MARQPEMWWRKSKNCWYVKIGGVQKRLDPDEKKARQKFYKLLGERPEDPSPTMLVSDLLARYLTWSEANHADTTHRRVKPSVESFSQSLRPGMRVNKLAALHLTEWLDKRCPKKPKDGSRAVSDNTRHDYATDVLGAFNWAVTQQIIPYSPFGGFKKPPKTPRADYLVPEQLDALLGTVEDEEFRDLLLFVRHTGCRPQEARIIEGRQVMLRERMVRIEKLLAKGKKEERKILLNDVAFEIVQRLVLKYPEGPIFRNVRGRPWTKDAINCRFYRRREKLPFRARAYTMRHTFATEALRNGAGEAATAVMMGHKDKSMVTKTYGHVDQCEDYLREALDKATRRA
jgi:integrase